MQADEHSEGILHFKEVIILIITIMTSPDTFVNKENIFEDVLKFEYEVGEAISSISEKEMSLKREQKYLKFLKEQLYLVKNQLASIQKGFNINEDLLKLSSLPSANLQNMGENAHNIHKYEQCVIVGALLHLHKSLAGCPSENVTVCDPTGLEVPLMEHQKYALEWLIWRENEIVSGGIFGDDRSLGRTLTMISLVLKKIEEGSKRANENDSSVMETPVASNKYLGGTLIICPSSLIEEWELELNEKVKYHTISYITHRGPRRGSEPKQLAKYNVVITTYAIVRTEFKNDTNPLFSIKWERIVLDDAHVIRNNNSGTAKAVFSLEAFNRWVLSDTPLQNGMHDFYSYMKFVCCRPFNNLNIWKKWVEAKDETGRKRLNILTKSLMLRRTTDVLCNEGKLHALPERSSETITIHLSEDELAVYEEVSNFSKSLLSQLLYQRSKKNQLLSHDIQNFRNKKFNLPETGNPFREHPALNKLYSRVVNKGNVNTCEILVLLLRLRQICCHPALMMSKIEKDTVMQDRLESEDGSAVDLLERMSSINVKDDVDENAVQVENCQASHKNVVMCLDNPIFKPKWISSKIKAILQLLDENLLKTKDKIVIVSQWSSMLDLIYDFLKEYKNCKCERLTGKTPFDQRTDIVSEFNENSSIKILLLSLTAGGTGLNLVGGNHLILTDLHWNPQIEKQACDHIYRVGQKKPVKIYKFVCTKTIEERILLLQNEKLGLADDIFSWSKNEASKLSLEDLKKLFSVK